MKNSYTYLLLLLILFNGTNLFAQFDPDKICRIEEDRIVFLLEPGWGAKEKKEVSLLFDLDSTLLIRAYQGVTTITFEGETWHVRKLKTNQLELAKPLMAKSSGRLASSDDLFALIDKWMNYNGKEAPSTLFGVNSFRITNAFHYGKKAWFYLAGRKTARSVFISGSFNGWSTSLNPMKEVETGWTAELDLPPGKYSYKFIVDGKWITDPSNNLKEDDHAGGYNSVVYCTNHLFQLKGNPNSKSVFVAGNFNNWNPSELAMAKSSDGWELPVYLCDGSYQYKFIVDRQWYTDPANPNERKDGNGYVNSVLSIGEPYLFSLSGYPEARKVILTGNFNHWKEDELLMDKTTNGWQLPYILPPGNYEYKFIVDGKWLVDPSNPFTTGSGDGQNSFVALKANHLFELEGYSDAREVIVTGNFLNWSKSDYRMVRKGGKWIFPIYLKPGKQSYKFIVDHNWIKDPGNNLYEPNEVGTDNSVLWIQPVKE